MSTHAPSLHTDALAYAAAVRSHLDDLPPDVLEELAGGLDADMTELAEDSDRPLGAVLGDPEAYAAELRSSAGLPLRPPQRPGLQVSLVRELSLARQQWQSVRLALDEYRWWGPLSGGVTSLRPAWWLVRAWVAFQLCASLTGAYVLALPSGPAGVLLLLVLTVGSVALGRGWLRRHDLVRGLVVGGNVLSVLTLPFALDRATDIGYFTSLDDEGAVSGLYLDGEQVRNVFPYDAEGQPLTDVQLLDDLGRPLDVGWELQDPYAGDGTVALVPAVDASGEERWNVYPLRETRHAEPGVRTGTGYPVVPAPLPAASVPPSPPVP